MRGSKKLQTLETEISTRKRVEPTMSNGAVLNGHRSEAAYSNNAFASNELARDRDDTKEPIRMSIPFFRFSFIRIF